MIRNSSVSGNRMEMASEWPMVAAPLSFPSADGPAAAASTPAPFMPDPTPSAARPWPMTAALVGVLCGLDALFIALHDGLGWRAGWVAVVTLAVAVLAGVLLARRLNRPVRALSVRAEHLAVRYTGYAVDRGHNEMQNLVASFDAMTGALLVQLDRLKGLHLEELQNSLELQRRYALMRLLRNLSTAALECEHLDQILERAVQELGEYLDWPIGRVLIVGDPGSRPAMAERSIWFVAEGERFASFISASEGLGAEHCAHGLIALAGATGMPHWVTDLGRLQQWQRRDAAVQSGLKTGFAIPIPGDGSTHAFIEFFSDHRVEASAEMIELVDAIHTELWRAGQRRQSRLRSAGSAARHDAANGASPRDTPGAAGR